MDQNTIEILQETLNDLIKSREDMEFTDPYFEGVIKGIKITIDVLKIYKK